MKSITVISLFFIILSLFGCDDVMMPSSVTLSVKNTDGIGIPGLEILTRDSSDISAWRSVGYTDIDGNFKFSTLASYKQDFLFRIVDIDGYSELGKFREEVVSLDDDLSDIRLFEE